MSTNSDNTLLKFLGNQVKLPPMNPGSQWVTPQNSQHIPTIQVVQPPNNLGEYGSDFQVRPPGSQQQIPPLPPMSTEQQLNQVCLCGIPMRMGVTKKDGPNKGRKFLACSKPRDQTCKMFKWLDAYPPNLQRATLPPPQQLPSSQGMPPITNHSDSAFLAREFQRLEEKIDRALDRIQRIQDNHGQTYSMLCRIESNTRKRKRGAEAPDDIEADDDDTCYNADTQQEDSNDGKTGEGGTQRERKSSPKRMKSLKN